MSLTSEEIELLGVLADASQRFGRVVGNGPTRPADLREVVDKIHQLQAMVLSQSAAREYPIVFRLLGDEEASEVVAE